MDPLHIHYRPKFDTNSNRKISSLHMKMNVNMSFYLQCQRRKFTSYTVIKKAFNRLIG